MTAHNLLPDHTIIVTGAATGIGQAFALGAAAQGAHVVVADMNAADETMDLIARAAQRRQMIRGEEAGQPSFNLSEARRVHGLPDYQAHDALTDAVA